MAKKLSEISREVQSSGDDFKRFLRKVLSAEVYHLIENLASVTDIYIFSGVIRNYFLKVDSYRDVDIVLSDEVSIEAYIGKYNVTRNSFGGYKILVGDTSLDIWYLNSTWAFRHQTTFNFSLMEQVPSTAFFNFSAAIYSFNEAKFYATTDFCRFLRDREINIVYRPNPNLALCVINTMYYEDRFKLKVAARMRRHIVELYRNYHFDYSAVQKRHFGEVLYSESEIAARIALYTTTSSRKKMKSRRATEIRELLPT